MFWEEAEPIQRIQSDHNQKRSKEKVFEKNKKRSLSTAESRTGSKAYVLLKRFKATIQE